MDIATKLRYKAINLNHFRRCMMSRINYQLSSYWKKGAYVPAFELKPAKSSSLHSIDSIVKKNELPSPIRTAGSRPFQG